MFVSVRNATFARCQKHVDFMQTTLMYYVRNTFQMQDVFENQTPMTKSPANALLLNDRDAACISSSKLIVPMRV